MCLLSLLGPMSRLGWTRPGLEESCVAEILSHQAGGPVREMVLPGGEILPGVEGRLLNPGHAIESGYVIHTC